MGTTLMGHTRTGVAALPDVSRVAMGVATAGSAVALTAGVVWLGSPHWNYYADPEVSLMGLLPAAVAAPTAAALQAALGLLGVLAGLLTAAGRLPRAGLITVSVVMVLGFGIALQGPGAISLTGYLVAAAMPVILAVLAVQITRRYPRARWLVGLPLAVVLVAVIVAQRRAIGVMFIEIGMAAAQQLDRIITAFGLILVASSWIAVLAGQLARGGELRRATGWVTRHRTAFTIIAACGPLPYALIRLTWLTPWPQFGMGELPIETRIWGLLLSSGAWLGSVLTVGLIRPWGEVFPRWMPGAAGRPVTIAAAAVPGGLVAGVLIFSAAPMLTLMPGSGVDRLVMALVLPFWLWGPALALAVWGYVGHRCGVR